MTAIPDGGDAIILFQKMDYAILLFLKPKRKFVIAKDVS